MIHGQVAYDQMEDTQSMNYVGDCRIRDAMRELRIEFYNKLGKMVNERILMEVGNSLLFDWKESEDNVISISEKLHLDEAHWRALDDDYEWVKNYLYQKDMDCNRDQDFYDLNW